MVPSPTLPPAPPARAAAARLNRDDWLDAAFAAAVEHGFDGVRVLVLADTLGVTRGSFYWHFKDHADLIAALLERWRAAEQASNQTLQEPRSEDPVKDLELLLDAALAHLRAEPRPARAHAVLGPLEHVVELGVERARPRRPFLPALEIVQEGVNPLGARGDHHLLLDAPRPRERRGADADEQHERDERDGDLLDHEGRALCQTPPMARYDASTD